MNENLYLLSCLVCDVRVTSIPLDEEVGAGANSSKTWFERFRSVRSPRHLVSDGKQGLTKVYGSCVCSTLKVFLWMHRMGRDNLVEAIE